MFSNRFLPIALSILTLSACGNSGGLNEAPATETISFLAFGDSGYHMDYVQAEEDEPPFITAEAFVEFEREEWLEDKKPIEYFRPAPLYFHKQLGSFVPASGMMPVANAMKSVCVEKGCDFAVMLGDNIYPDGATLGADGMDDATRFEKVFNQPFGDLGQNTPDFRTYATLGNHDWKTSRGGAQAQVDYLTEHPAFYMDGFIYRVKPTGTNGQVELFIVDTELMLGGTTVYEDALADDGSEIRRTELDENEPWARPANELEADQVSWLEQALKDSNAKWKFLIAHHPVWSSSGSKFEQGRALRRLLMPVACRYADAYFAGHEHTLEVHEDSCADTGVEGATPLPQIVSGAAAKQRGANRNFMAYQDRVYPHKITHYVRDMVWGFSRVQLEDNEATVVMYAVADDGSGEVREDFSYRFTRRSGR